MGITVAVIGASGRSGGELCRLLLGHPDVDRIVPASRGDTSFERTHPHLAGCGLTFVGQEAVGDVDVALLCTPAGEAMLLARPLLERGIRVVDVSPDFRFTTAAAYEAAYGREHAAPELLDQAACGITELHRARVASSRLVANPGCYAITAVLALAPLLAAGIVRLDAPLHLHAINGTSGAGTTPKSALQHARVQNSMLPYALDGHRHAPEIEERFAEVTGGEAATVSLSVAHGDFVRGIHLQASVPLHEPHSREALLAVLLDAYGRGHNGEHFVVINAEERTGELNDKDYAVAPQLRDVVGSNLCRIGIDVDRRMPIARVVAVTDNLVKGAAGSAIQNMNVMLGLEETAGLRAYAL